MISVIIPMYNSEQSIVKCLDSVKAQTWTGKFEILIVNDGSTDQSAEAVQEYMARNPGLDITLIHQQNQGVSKARNVAMERSKGDFIALLDADDEWLPQKTEKQMMQVHDKGLQIDFISCLINKDKLLFPYFSNNKLAKVTFRKLLFRNGIASPTVIFKKEIIANTGYFDCDQMFAEDHNYWLKISQKNKMYILAENLVIAGNGKRTFGVSGLSANLKEMEKGFHKNLRDMYCSGRISYPEFVTYSIFYRLKYALLLSRSLFYKLKGR